MLKSICFLIFVCAMAYTYSQGSAYPYQKLSAQMGESLSIGSTAIGSNDTKCTMYAKMNIKKVTMFGIISPEDSIFNYSFPTVDTLITTNSKIDLSPFPNVKTLVFYIHSLNEEGVKDSLEVITPYPEKIRTVIITEASNNPHPIFWGSSFFKLTKLETLCISTLVCITQEVSELKNLRCLLLCCHYNRVNPSGLASLIDLRYFSHLETLAVTWLEKTQYEQLKALGLKKLILGNCSTKELNKYVFSCRSLEDIQIYDIHKDIYSKGFPWEQTPSKVRIKGGYIGYTISNLKQLKVFRIGESVKVISPDLSFFRCSEADTLRQTSVYRPNLGSTLRLSAQIGTLQNLEILDISNRRRTPIVVPHAIKHCKKLQSFTIQGGSLTKVPKLMDMPNLTDINLAGNVIRTWNLDINRLPKLERIDLSYNPISIQMIPSELRVKAIVK